MSLVVQIEIGLDDYLTRLADEARAELLDDAKFPTMSAEVQWNPAQTARFVSDRVRAYWTVQGPWQKRSERTGAVW